MSEPNNLDAFVHLLRMDLDLIARVRGEHTEVANLVYTTAVRHVVSMVKSIESDDFLIQVLLRLAHKDGT